MLTEMLKHCYKGEDIEEVLKQGCFGAGAVQRVKAACTAVRVRLLDPHIYIMWVKIYI